MLINELITYLNELLKPEMYQDFSPNGLQIAGVDHIECLITGVSANLALIDAAIQSNADALLVHHGFFWKNEDVCITGIRHSRFSKKNHEIGRAHV